MQFKFEKFMNNICQKEKPIDQQQINRQQVQDTPQQKYNKLYREKWQNRVKFFRRKNESN